MTYLCRIIWWREREREKERERERERERGERERERERDVYFVAKIYFSLNTTVKEGLVRPTS